VGNPQIRHSIAQARVAVSFLPSPSSTVITLCVR